MLQKTNRLSLVEQVTAQLQERIETGAWAPGARIPAEPELMESLGVSRNTLREAIRALTHTGMLRTRQGDGTYVVSSSALAAALQNRVRKTEWLETLEVRRALEREAAILAARRRTEEELDVLRDCYEQCVRAVARQDKNTYLEWDMRFHQAVFAASRNALLMELYSNIAEGLRGSIESTMKLVSEALINKAHEQLLRAIERQDEAMAEAAVLRYIQDTQITLE
ncbi:FadR/GntR family transcriptional regulator [Cohnella fermenti]|uniref:FadR family transcriptional regulator n=1 Tax=Cohnella fermenti TaxID=2565925 RepID=A0A4V3WED1_9BACL|nr:FadR/GntR family transcriptional regulator [Cohnella fermenti]THF75765.1 FadR family transcriptional regulator [Cohnella fermenti]